MGLTLALFLFSRKKGFFYIFYIFYVKDPIPRGLRTCVVYKFLCAGRNAYYVGETSRHLSTRVREHLVSDRTSHATPDQYERTVPI